MYERAFKAACVSFHHKLLTNQNYTITYVGARILSSHNAPILCEYYKQWGGGIQLS